MPSLGSHTWPVAARRGSATCRSQSATKRSVKARKARRQSKARSR